ncbi:hypothetical protein FHR92_003010 [Fontibacillus solani]|uniref:Replicative helicase inhibitor G39P N-terminal domain-containing protein n=1 Tax=Fontibacillus solani TaxID=1572857 RepID=A0A7W3SUN2_9BACL|nr:hypothetical protein [Fontibacillus solani]MBA9086532.1 hypothetical protein [Fontibacillus solani]
MQRDEVALLFMTIREHYPKFDISIANLNRFHERLEDFPYELARTNLEEYIKTNRYRVEPLIGDLRGGIGSRKELEQSREDGRAYLTKWDEMRSIAVDPPKKAREQIDELKRQRNIKL